MKNGIIVLLALVCIFFLMNAIGVFQFGSIIDRNHRSWHESLRENAVKKSPTLKFGTAYDSTDLPAVEAVKGMEFAIEMLNRKGGVLGKKLELEKRSNVKNLPQLNASIQDFCDDHAIASVIGPFSSGYIPAARALTQYQGLPLISPLTVFSEKLPPLTPDNFITFFPPLTLWVDAILEDMVKKGYKNLLIISPPTDTYGDIFCTAVERASRHRPIFDRVSRLNYQHPLRRKDLLRTVRNYSGENFANVVFFGGDFLDFPEFIALMNELDMSLPVYATDDLYLPQIREMDFPFPLFLPRAVLWRKDSPFVKEWQQRFQKEPSYHTFLGAESMFSIATALDQAGVYHPEKLLNSLREIHRTRLLDADHQPDIVIDEFAVQPPPQQHPESITVKSPSKK